MILETGILIGTIFQANKSLKIDEQTQKKMEKPLQEVQRRKKNWKNVRKRL